MEELVKQTQPIFQKLGDFFDLFDLSFMVSGIATSLSLLFLYHNLTDEDIIKSIKDFDGFLIFLSIIVVYLLGLISWVLGKWVRDKLNKTKYKSIETTFKHNNALSDDLFQHYYTSDSYANGKDEDKERVMAELYCRLWGIIRESNLCLNSFSLLKRYWVQTANFEGLIFSTVSWFAVLSITWYKNPIFNYYCYGISLVILVFIFFAFKKEAVNYKKYQMIELVITYLTCKEKRKEIEKAFQK